MGRTRDRYRTALVLAVLALTAPAAACAQGSGEVHPGKAEFADADAWPATTPGDVALRNFQPFRAVYARTYRDAEGQEVTDRVIVTAERVAWDETDAVLVTLVDTGTRDLDNTTARIQTRVFGESDQRLLLQLTPAPGTAKDYIVIHPEPSPARVTTVTAETGEGSLQSMPIPLPQLGMPGFWLLGSMPLEEGQRVRFAPADAPAPSSILGARPVIVGEREEFDAGPAGRHTAWAVRYPLGMAGPRVMLNFVTDRPPYLLGKRPLNLDTGESTEVGTLRLIEFTTFGDAPGG